MLASLARGGVPASPTIDSHVDVDEHDQVEMSEQVVEDAEGDDIASEVVILPAEDTPSGELQAEPLPESKTDEEPVDQDLARRRRRRRGRRGRGRGTGPADAQAKGESKVPVSPKDDESDIESDEFDDAPRGRRTVPAGEDWPVDLGVT
ncbi:MAG: hypothetical protein IPK83_15930 [Planctomycetes bacterium]|nr:hypothetical protein [Planctomycetota bacterium]